jgi:hypothetical protein
VALLALRDVAVLARGAAGLALRGRAAFGPMVPSLLGKATTAAQFAFLLALLVVGKPVVLLFVPAAILSGLAALDYLRLTLTTDRAPARPETPSGMAEADQPG